MINGRELWKQTSVNIEKSETSNSFSDINANPVILKSIIVIASTSGKVFAMNKKNGNLVWEQYLNTTQTPLVNGNNIFIIHNNKELLNLDLKNGKIRWITEIPKNFSDENKEVNDLKIDIDEKKKTALAAGGLYVIGTERHESRRIDNQLRGRTGRQGDPGRSKFLLSLQDDLMRIFGSERLETMLGKLGLEKGEAIIHPWINKAVEKAQAKVEAHNFEIRKQLLKFDDVMNDQRKVIFDQRKDIMRSNDISTMITDMRHEVIEAIVYQSIPDQSYYDEWDVESLSADVKNYLGLTVPINQWVKEDGIIEKEFINRLTNLSDKYMAERAVHFGVEVFRQAEKTLLLQVLDQGWKDHLLMLDQMRQSIGLRAYAQKGENIVRSSCVGCGICSAVCPRGVLKLENGPEKGRINPTDILLGNNIDLIQLVNKREK